jgi:calcineurin-like phosphoesterase family protein
MACAADRRNFLKLAGLGGVVFASSLGFPLFTQAKQRDRDFYWVQLSDTHWGFDGPAVNPDAKGTLVKAVTAVNALAPQPDFVVFTGDLTHSADDPGERRRRMAEFREIVRALRVPTVRFMPGEHDAALDRGKAYREYFGEPNYVFAHKGIQFIVLDNVSDPAATLGEIQLEWLREHLGRLQHDTPIVVLTHRPLFDLYPQWDWATRDGERAIELLMPYRHVAVFYGHIHQVHHHTTGHIAHHAAQSLMFPLPAPGSVAKRQPVAWDPAAPYKGLGVRSVGSDPASASHRISDQPVRGAGK